MRCMWCSSGAWSHNMGALIWPMLTLILKNKMGMSASEIASLLLLLGCVQLPCMILGGRAGRQVPQAQYYHCVRPCHRCKLYGVRLSACFGPDGGADVPCGRVCTDGMAQLRRAGGRYLLGRKRGERALQPEVSGRQPVGIAPAPDFGRLFI